MKWTPEKETRLIELGNEVKLRKLQWEQVAKILTEEFGEPMTVWQIRKKFYRLQSKIVPQSSLGELEQRLLNLMKRGKTNLIDLANALDVAPKRVQEAVERLKSEGYNVLISEDNTQIELSRAPFRSRSFVTEYQGERVKFGIISDLHICSKYHHADALRTLYDIFEQEGITQVYIAGNIVDGEKTYLGQEYEITCVGAENQAKAFCEQLPKKKGITTYFITSSTCHEGYYYKSTGLLIGDVITNPNKPWYRDDLVYLGMDEVDVIIKQGKRNVTMRLLHPSGGTAYAYSYRPQKIVESYFSGQKPNILIIGHYHKASYNMIRNVHVIQAGCLQYQTPFMRKRAIEAHIGGWIIEFNIGPDNSVNRFKSEWIHFFK